MGRKFEEKAFMTSPIGDLPINSEGLRKAIDYITEQKAEIKQLKQEKNGLIDERFAVCHALRQAIDENKKLQQTVEALDEELNLAKDILSYDDDCPLTKWKEQLLKDIAEGNIEIVKIRR